MRSIGAERTRTAVGFLSHEDLQRRGFQPSDLPWLELCAACDEAWQAEQEFCWALQHQALLRRDELCEGKPTSLYLVFDGYAVKIWVAQNPVARLSNLQVANPRQLLGLVAVPATERFERFLQDALVEDRIRGEWFLATARVLAVSSVVRSCAEMQSHFSANGDGPFSPADTIAAFVGVVEDAIEQAGRAA